MIDIGLIREQKILISIVGPTGSGKSNLAMELAKTEKIEIISADSRQIYKYMDIGTAKPTKDELKMVKHHFISQVEPDEYYSAGQFEEEADIIYNDILNRGKIPVLVGGSGLYINAMVNGIFDEDDVFEKNNILKLTKEELKLKREKIKKELVDRHIRYGIYDLYFELEKVDRKSAEKYNDKNPVRVIRALEFFLLFGQPLSKYHQNEIKTNEKDKYKAIYFQVDIDRETLYDRINRRVDVMMEEGWIDEVKYILEMGFDYKLNSLNTVGYKEIIDYLDEDSHFYKDTHYMEDKIKQKTRNYAKRQVTWFKKYAEPSYYVKNVNELNEMLVKLIK